MNREGSRTRVEPLLKVTTVELGGKVDDGTGVAGAVGALGLRQAPAEVRVKERVIVVAG